MVKTILITCANATTKLLKTNIVRPRLKNIEQSGLIPNRRENGFPEIIQKMVKF